MSKHTFVTALFDLAKRESRSATIDYYHGHLQKLVNTNLPLHLYGEPDVLHPYRSYVNVTFTEIELEELLSYRHHNAMVAAEFLGRAFRNRDQKKDTPLFHVVNHAKPWFVDQAASAAKTVNGGDASLSWIDAGIFHLEDAYPTMPRLTDSLRLLHDRYESASPERIRICQMNPCPLTLSKEIAFRTEYNWYYFCGGLFTVPWRLTTSFAKRVDAMLERVLEEGFVNIDEMTIALVYGEHAEDFDPYPGDYPCIAAHAVNMRHPDCVSRERLMTFESFRSMLE